MSEVLVTVIVPVYNVEPYLEQCVTSIVQQTYPNLEILLINDGSTDGSGNICDALALSDKRIKVFHQKNQGLSGARNTGNEAAQGRFITYLDSDDWLAAKAIESSVQIALANDYDVVFWRMVKEYNSGISVLGNVIFKGDTVFLGKSMQQLHRRLIGPVGAEMAQPHLTDSFASAWGKLFKTDLIRKHNLAFVDTKIIGSEDILFNIQYFHLCKSAYFLDSGLIHYRKDNPTSLTKTHGSTLFPRFVQLFEHIGNYLDANNCGPVHRLALNNRIAISMMNIGLSETSPRNTKSAIEKIKSISGYLGHPTYRAAYQTTELGFLPVHWRAFYFCCKIRFATGAFVLLKAMRLFIRS